MTFDDTPFYFYNEDVAKKIKNYFPKTKLIIILRNPIDRAYSNYNLSIRANTEKLSFEDAIEEEMRFLDEHSFRESVDRQRSYIAKGIYEKQINFWFEIFPKKNGSGIIIKS